MPKGNDVTFTSKLYDLWDKKSKQFKPSRKRNEGFILTHYAADVEYSTEHWLSKNKDPLNDNITTLLASSTDSHIASLFEGMGTDNAAIAHVAVLLEEVGPRTKTKSKLKKSTRRKK